MKTLFAATIAMGLATADTQGQEALEQLELSQDIVVTTDGPATVIKFQESDTYTNHFRIVCPSDPFYNQSRGRGKPSVFLFNKSRSALEAEHRHGVRAQYTEKEGEIGTTSTGMIGNNNTLSPIYNFKQETEIKGRFIQTPGPLPGSDPRDRALIRALQKHAEQFCYSLS